LEAFEKIYVDGVYVIAVNLTRSTLNEAAERAVQTNVGIVR